MSWVDRTEASKADELQDVKVENALLRGALYLTANALIRYQEAPHFEIEDDGRAMVEVLIPETLRAEAADALARIDRMLRPQARNR